VNSWKIILSTLVIFGAGVVTGGLLVSYTLRANQIRMRPANSMAATPWQLRSRDLLHRMERELDLTPGQRETISKLITDSQERTKSLWKPIAPRMNRELQQLHEGIRDELTPEQRRKFDELLKQRQAQSRNRLATNSPSLAITNSLSTNAEPVNP
jgi:Spy/CpxP family protein refolding chaperone